MKEVIKAEKKNQKSKNKLPVLKDKTLVIVESPSKAKTINKYLGKDYIVEASMGHLIDLPKSRLGIDIEKNFEPEYIYIRGKSNIINKLKKIAKDSKNVLLATDPDREGEAISFHIANFIKIQNPNIRRIEFHEITENSIKNAIHNPRDININLVNAQQARRILDRIVGYYISPILWKKIKKGLSAGRVQSVALRLICEREEEIEKFIPQEYWSIEGEFSINKKKLNASLAQINGKSIEIKKEEEAREIVSILESISDYNIANIRKKERKRQSTAPYTTSKLQQDASTKLGFTSQKTMSIAQQLYEGVEIDNSPVGLITYMRTDSTRISNEALKSVRNYIENTYGREYLSEKIKIYSKTSANAQEAHEAIRPTDLRYTPEYVEKYLTKDQFKLYKLIWDKFVSSQMADEISEITTIDIVGEKENNKFLFRTSFKKTVFRGFTILFSEDEENDIKKDIQIKENDRTKLIKITPQQHFTQPPPRYNDASLVKKLEEEGIGRPSTYAPTIQTLLKRYYIIRQQKSFKPTQLGILVNEMITKFFPKMVDLGFTAKMENELDLIANSELDWQEMLKQFYIEFLPSVQNATQNMEDLKTTLDEPTNYNCEKCGKPMVKKIGRKGYFLACSGFPQCINAKPIPLGKCPKCKTGDIVQKNSRKKNVRIFYGCNRYPECDFTTWDIPHQEYPCPQCGNLLFKKGNLIYCGSCDFKKELVQE